MFPGKALRATARILAFAVLLIYAVSSVLEGQGIFATIVGTVTDVSAPTIPKAAPRSV
jgi:hypothetical protein